MKKGLCLGAGGVKGFVHLGVLTFLEELGITFDYVSGCSIGSIVGGLYCLGFTPKDMVKEIVNLGFDNPQKLLYYRFNENSISGLLNDILQNKTFKDCLIPFRCVGVNINTGKSFVFDKGSLADAMTASSAIPPYLRPYRIGGEIYVDGAFLNSVPADVTSQMGAEKILSVNLSYGRPFNYGNKNNLDKFYPKNKVPLAEVTWQCYKYSSLVIEPDLREYKAFSLANLDDLFFIGYNEAKKQKEKLFSFRDEVLKIEQ